MRKLLLFLFFMGLAAPRYVYCQDNLLAVDVIDSRQKTAAEPAKTIPKAEEADKPAELTQEEPLPNEDMDKDFKKIKAYREHLDNKQKELEIIKLELEKSSLLLKKKQAEKEIYEIDKALPQGKKGALETISLNQEKNEPLVDSSDIKVQLLLISDNLKEGQLSLKGTPYNFREGDMIASKLTVETIEPSSVTFRQPDNSLLKVNFIN